MTDTAQPCQERRASGHAFERVLCAVDGTGGGFDAVERAAALAGPGGKITVLLVTSYRKDGEHRSPHIGPIKAKQILDRAIAIGAEAGVEVTAEVDPAAPPAHVILEWAADHDLLAMGAPTTPWFGGMFTGGATVAALGSLPTPLLIGRAMPAAGADGQARVLVASDGLKGSGEVVELGGRVARSQGAAATLLHAVGPEGGVRPERIEEQARRLAAVSGTEAEPRFEAGSARTVVLDTARALHASLIVMGSRRLEGVRTIGSVGRRVAHGAACSVLLVPPERLGPGAGA
ncbi:MAG TPA: universal stress protein [Solirubrobacteraceae bacterium]